MTRLVPKKRWKILEKRFYPPSRSGQAPAAIFLPFSTFNSEYEYY